MSVVNDDPNWITINDVREAGYCASGARRWFELHGLNFRDFMQNGMSAEDMLGVGDVQGITVVEKKRARVLG